MSLNKKTLETIIGRLVIIALLIGLLLTACSVEGSAQGGVNWLFLVLSILCVAVLALGLVLLGKSGKLQEWSSAGINAGKWKLEERKLKNQKETVEQQIQDRVAELGEKAWEAKVYHDAYQEPYQALKEYDSQIISLKAESKDFEGKLNQVHDSRSNLFDDYSTQLKDLASLKKDVENELGKSRSQGAKLTKNLEKLNKDQAKALAEIESQQQELQEVQASDLPDKDKKVEALTKSINDLQRSVSKTSENISETELEQSKLEIAQQPMLEKIARFDDQIVEVEENQRQALAPLDQQIVEIEGEIKSRNDEISSIHEKMNSVMHSMGPLVESARPESEELTRAYYEVDKVQTQLSEIKQQHHLVFARLEASDQKMVRNFYLMVAGALVLVVLIVVFLVMAF